MFNKLIINKINYMTDVINILKDYCDKMESYYSNIDNTYKDKFVYESFIKLQRDCVETAKKRGLIK